MHGLRQHLASARGAVDALRLESGDCWLLSLPLYHVGGASTVFRTALTGATLAIALPHTEWDDAWQRLAPTHVSVVAAQLLRVLADDRATARLRGAKTVLGGGGPLPVAVRRAALDAGIPLVPSYGSTETASLVTAETDRGHAADEACAGRVLATRRLSITDDGEILVGGATLLDGYLTDEGVVDPRDADGWHGTGDLGRVENGRLYVEGRVDRMFVSGGENVHPEEIERALELADGVAEAVVVAVPHAEYGERPVAFVRALPGTAPSEADVRAHLEASLPRFKVPDRVLPMPADRAGLKPDRARLRELALEQL